MSASAQHDKEIGEHEAERKRIQLNMQALTCAVASAEDMAALCQYQLRKAEQQSDAAQQLLAQKRRQLAEADAAAALHHAAGQELHRKRQDESERLSVFKLNNQVAKVTSVSEKPSRAQQNRSLAISRARTASPQNSAGATFCKVQ